MTIFRKATLATALTATALSAASPAMAQGYYYGHRSGGGDTAGAAIAGGIIGLAIGAIVASSATRHNDYDHRYADRGWQWRDGYYWDRQGRRFDRDGRPCEERADRQGYYERQGYYDRRGYDERGYGYGDRGYYGRDGYYGQRSTRYGY
ncbi:hypothetical protein ACFOD9_06565 [Novosphingobium bradum]|uniref:17 kDa surface antigen n=1 Tax=Novosphingobium bradum TaxID=1737444 RepID=A0ABV7IQL5_9SPHN